AQDSIITMLDCESRNGIRMRAIIDAGQIVASLATRILGRTAAEDLKEAAGTVIVAAGEMVQEWHIDRINAAGIQEVKIRSVLTCEAKNGVCGKCYGRDLARGTPVNMGEAVGVIAAQSIGEPGTQLTMRTFHIGGAAQIADQSFIESNFDGVVRIRNRHLARNSEGDLMVMARNVAIIVEGPDGVERAVHRIQYGARLKVDDGDKIKRGQRIAEWDPYTRPILTEVAGIVGFEDLVEGASMTETIDEATGIAKRLVMDWRLNQRSATLKPAIVIKSADGKIGKLNRGGEARYVLPVDSIIAVDPGTLVKAGDIVARISMDSAKTRDITGGLPRVAELFEARKPKDNAVIAKIDGRIEFGKDYKTKRRIIIHPEDGSDAVEYMIPKGKH
ncbi:MAG: DNA-directed RNA polymerase subunit beta', partial [Methylocella sp.]